jgi:hypothetical protein
MSTQHYVDRARRELMAKSIDELAGLMRSIVEEENMTTMLEDVRQNPQHKSYMVELLLEHCAIGIFNEHATEDVKNGKGKIKGSTMRFQSSEQMPLGDQTIRILTVSQCAQCQKSSTDQKLLKCSRCQNCYYCSKECQKIHWKLHKQICCTS